MEIVKIAVMGAGAVGCYFGGMLARAGKRVTLIGRRAPVETIARDGLFLDSFRFQERIAVAASTQPDAARDADLVLFAVKTTENESAARQLQPHLAPGATLLSLQNGVDNVEQIRAASGIVALPAVVYVAASVPEPGRIRHVARGDLIIGDTHRREEIAGIARCFEEAGVSCRVSENIEGELWTKMIMNCAYNAISALSHAPYGRVAGSPWTRAVMRK